MNGCNVVWHTPSKDSSASMPLGNGDIGLNVWVEEDGDLLFYVGKTDAWSENARLLKLGRIRIKLSPNPFLKGEPFVQTLNLEQGEIEIRAGKGEAEILFTVWVDANQPVIRVEGECASPSDIEVILEVWRESEHLLPAKDHYSAWELDEGPAPVIVHPDTVLEAEDERLVWFHRNKHSIWRQSLAHQGLQDWIERGRDPLLNVTFGGGIKGDGLLKENARTLKSPEPGTGWTVSIYPLTAQAETVDEWLRRLDESIARIDATNPDAAREAHRKWWKEFWDRSRLRLSGSREAEKMGQAYALQRFLNACSGRGKYPIKWNGSIFTTDAERDGENYSADYRMWGGPYWFQNTRLVYWPMLASGDSELMHPLFRMYLELLPMASLRTRLYYGHEGAFFPETLSFWGTYANRDYGWDREGKPVGHVDNPYIRYYWQGGLELAAMMLEHHAHTQDEGFVKETLLPFAEAVVRFYDQHYPRDEQGRILLKPAQALETWTEAVNPLPEIAGLRVVLGGLLALPEQLTTDEQRGRWKRILGELPALPSGGEKGQEIILPAEQTVGDNLNQENVELWAVFPYRLYGIGKPDIETARRTFEQRRWKEGVGCWLHDAVLAACLGIADVARDFAVRAISDTWARSRFPAFFHGGWIPAQDHGNVVVLALQTMLLQADGERIYLFPAWPKEWDVDFKLHAPLNTTVEGTYRGGKLEQLKVLPEAREKNLEILAPQ